MIPETRKIECEPIYAADYLTLSQMKVFLMYLCIIFCCTFPYSLSKGYHLRVNTHCLLLIGWGNEFQVVTGETLDKVLPSNNQVLGAPRKVLKYLQKTGGVIPHVMDRVGSSSPESGEVVQIINKTGARVNTKNVRTGTNILSTKEIWGCKVGTEAN
ncbi:hypothetical protein DSO57_1007611 [Entomophthora muscae]|uniref:Uncharacterized protein n=1 Tax=Entomophthora muscae TaxID=34485 RepID=A0ACC2RYH2_9FUNG|nr:hypothetical protein DSO57_1007611 [Entomophthora muscae]